MSKQLLGKEVNASLNERIKTDVLTLQSRGITPTLGIIRVGEREDDLSYERGATKRCESLGVSYKKYVLPADVSEEALIAQIEEINADDSVHGVLLFRPLPRHLNEEKIINVLDPAKDVDGITDISRREYSPGRIRATRPAHPLQ